MFSDLLLLGGVFLVVFLILLAIFCKIAFKIKDSWDSQWFLMKASNQEEANQTLFVVGTYSATAIWIIFTVYWILFPW